MQNGNVESFNSLLPSDANAYFTDQVIADFVSSLGPLGDPLSLTESGAVERGGMTERAFVIRSASQNLSLSTMSVALRDH